MQQDDNTAINAAKKNPQRSSFIDLKFLFPNFAKRLMPNVQRQVSAMMQWRPEELPILTRKTTDDVYLWMSLVLQKL